MPQRPVPNSEVWIRDLLEAVAALKPGNDDAVQYILGALGVVLMGCDPPVPPKAPMSSHERSAGERPAGEESATAYFEPVEETPELEEIPPLSPLPEKEKWGQDIRYGDATLLAEVAARHRNPVLPHIPLLRALATRPILQATLATGGPGGPIDIDTLVEKIARREPIEELPRLLRPSLFRGVTVLVDNNWSMAPFVKDQRGIVDQICLLVGKDLVEVRNFDGSLSRGCGVGPRRRWGKFQPPHPGTPVLVLGDMGIREQDEEIWNEWIRDAKMLNNRGSRMVALVPYAQNDWPPLITGHLDFVKWDHDTAISDIEFRVRI